MKTHRREPRKARGQVLVIYTIALVALLGAVALCTDVAILYFNWGQLQKAADAAAVAGAHYLPNDTTTATSTAKDYAAKNGVPSSQVVSVTFSANDTQITVKLQRSVGLFFARVFNFLSAPVTVQATAEIQNVGGAGNILPIGLSCDGITAQDCGNYDPTTGTYVLKYGQVSGAPGNWEPLAVGANGANQYRNNLAYGYQGDVTLNQGMPVPTEPGNMMGPTLQGLNIRLQDSTYAPGSVGDGNLVPPPTDLSSVTNDSRLVVVPMVNYADTAGKTSLPIESFALMWIGEVGSDGTIYAYFLKSAQSAGDLMPDSGAPNTGPYGVALID